MEWEKMRQVAMIFTTTVLSGLVLTVIMQRFDDYAALDGGFA
jgi:hypothetical protein